MKAKRTETYVELTNSVQIFKNLKAIFDFKLINIISMFHEDTIAESIQCIKDASNT